MDSYLERLRRELEHAIAGANPANLQSVPDSKWSPAQILEHLFLTYQGTNRGVAKCLAKGTSIASAGTFKDRVRSFVVVNLGYFPSGRKAPERAVPKGMPAEVVQHAIFGEIGQMDTGLAECERKFGPSIKIMDHPVLGPLSVRQWRKFHWVHGRHHARQIRERLGIREA
jgi:hypothetical protein